MSFKAKQIAKRNSEGGITRIDLEEDCNICEGISKGKYITHVIEIRASKLHYPTNICKTCLCEALAELNKRILED